MLSATKNTKLRQHFKYRVLSPARYGLARIRESLGSATRPVRILLATDFGSYTSDQQFAPFMRYNEKLGDRLGVATLITDVDNANRILSIIPNHFDLVGVKLSFRTAPSEALSLVTDLRAKARGRSFVYFDGDDDLGVQWPEVLSTSDLYVKKHAYKDRRNYGLQTVGKSNLTNYAHLTLGADFNDDIIPKNAPLPEDQLGKIMVGWNIALDDKIDALRHQLAPMPIADRPVDIVCRATVNRESWLYHLRKGIVPALEPLETRFKVITPTNRVAQDVYYQEMLSSKLCVSPFGYGELCWRDFEAVLSGCVLVKPDMGHVETAPDIFIPHETYIPVSWDFSNLSAECERYLNMPDECQRIAENARAKLLGYYERDLFLETVDQILSRLGLGSKVNSKKGDHK